MTQSQVQAKRTDTLPKGDFDAVIVGAGFAGLYMLHRLREMGFNARVLEAGSGVGGTWYWNRYPGARCDVESVQYSFQFSDALQQEWDWSERYAAQPELLRYANHVADRFDLRRDIQFNTRVSRASFDEIAGRWVIETSDGARITAIFCIMATGCLSSPNMPAFKGLETFAGERYHTGYWPHENIDFTGKRVAIIGTGSSAVQSIPIIAGQAKQLFVFQRTPNYAIPAHNAPLTPEYRRAIKADYAGLRERARKNMTGIDFDYSETFNRPNVTLIDVSESGIEAITRQGVKVEGREYKVDAIVFATGFDAMTGALLKIDIRGKGGRALREKWREGPRTYLGLGMAGFPNLFTITGPGSPSVLTNMLPTIEQHVDWIADCLGYLRDHGLARIEPSEQAEQDWGAHVGELAGRTLRYTCGSWYLGVNIPGKPRVFMPYIGGFPRYIEKCSEVAGKRYEGFLLG